MAASDGKLAVLKRGPVGLAIVLVGIGLVAWRMGGNAGHAGSFLLGVVLLLAGGKWLVDGAIVIARRLGWSTLTIGLTIVACGTSLPELAFTLIAASRGNGALAFGNIVGSNISNIGLVLGLAAMIRAIDVHGRVVKIEVPLLVLASIGMSAAAWLPRGAAPAYGTWHGVALLTVFAAVFTLWYRGGSRESGDPLMREAQREVEEASDGRPALLMFALFVLGLGLLIAGAKLAEIGAVGIAAWLGMSQALIGLTIVAIATSLPEVATTIAACLKNHTDLAIGNVVGSNLFNILLVLGATAAVAPHPVPVPAGTGWQDLACMVGITGVLTLFVMTQRRVTRLEGIVLLALYSAYLSWSVAREVM